MSVLKAYKFKIYPDEAQKEFFVKTFGCVRFTYNHLLISRSQTDGKKRTPASLKKEYPFLKETDSLALANAQRNLETAFRRYFTGKSDYPKFKNKSNIWQSYTTNNQGQTICLKDGLLKLPKLKTLVPVNEHREIKGQIKSATISAKNNQEFYVSILCLESIDALPKTTQEIQLRYSPEELLYNSKCLTTVTFDQAALVCKMDRMHRRLKLRGKIARKNKVPLAYAKNYQKQKVKLSRLQGHQKEKKEDYFNQLSYTIIRDFDRILIDKTTLAEGQSNENVNFTKADWQTFLRKLQYKADWYGKEIIYQ